MSEVCPIRVDGTYCGEPATWRVVGMCVHEHNCGGLCCDTCVEDARRLFLSEPQGCIACRESEQSHVCLVDVEIVPVQPAGDGLGERYECAVCHGTFTKTWSDEEAMAEMNDLWADTSGPADVVCDGCFQQVMGWARSEAPDALRRQP